MDPLTQASVGAAVAAMVSRRPETRRAIILGALAGMAPDLDVLIRSEVDPLHALEYHRHFSHAILTAPLIGLLVAGVFKGLFFWKHWPYGRLALFGILGALTHGLIDACTSYGTMLYWPVHTHRESWDIISIVDPIFTVPLCLLTSLCFICKRRRFVQVAIGLCLLYLSFGVYQRSQAMHFAERVAHERGHRVTELTVRPSFANTLLWRVVYRTGDRYYVDAVRVAPFSEPKLYPGNSVEVFGPLLAHAIVPSGSVLADDIERFRFFSQGYLYRSPNDPSVAGDLRYAMFPDSIEPLWGIRVNPEQAGQHAPMVYFREPSSDAFGRLWKMIRGETVDTLN